MLQMRAAGVYACGMNPAVHAATAAATAHALADKKIIGHFQSARAFGPDSAIDASQLPEHPASVLDALRKRQLVRATGDGRLYFDRKRYEAQQARARQIGIWVIFLLFISGLSITAWAIYHA